MGAKRVRWSDVETRGFLGRGAMAETRASVGPGSEADSTACHPQGAGSVHPFGQGGKHR